MKEGVARVELIRHILFISERSSLDTVCVRLDGCLAEALWVHMNQSILHLDVGVSLQMPDRYSNR